MIDATITLKNYRSFSQQEPAHFSIRGGLTGFIGPNNSGKSSLLKSFHEFRNYWGQLTSNNNIGLLFRSAFSPGYQDLYDPKEIFCDSNEDPLVVEFAFPEPTEIRGKSMRWIGSIQFSCRRDNPTAWHTQSWLKPQNEELVSQPISWEYSNIAVGQSQGKFFAGHVFELFRALTDTLYLPPFRNAINEGSATHFGLLVGSSFIDTWHEWKTGADKARNRAVELVTQDIRRIFGYEKLEIAASPQLKTLSIYVNGRPFKLREMGAGITQFVIALGNVAIRKPSILCVDEPELNLHPTLQVDFLTALASYTKIGTWFASHSIGLARALADQLYSLKVTRNGSLLRTFDSTPNYAEFVGELSFSTFRELGFDKLLLVEGVTEVKTIQQFLRKLKKDHQILLLPLGGNALIRDGVEQELDELKRITTKIFALIDSEKTSNDAPLSNERAAFVRSCTKLGYQVHVTVLRATENYLSDRAIKAYKGPKYRALAPYEGLTACNPGWGKDENWRIANLMEVEEFDSSDLGRFLAKI